ncbi:MAG: sigma-70 family RNA polymerase sigma factor [Hyphomicrobiaceae bacterium]
MPLPSPAHARLYERALVTPILTEPEETELFHRIAQGDDKAVERVVEAHLRLALSMARKYATSKFSIDDATAAAMLGLMQAIPRFRLSKSVRFGTYARHWILASLRETSMHASSMLKRGTTHFDKTLFFGLGKACRSLGIDYTKDGLSHAEETALADAFNMPVETIRTGWQRRYADASLNETVRSASGDDDVEHIDMLSDENAFSEAMFIEAEERELRLAALREAMATLNEREHDIVTARRMTEPPATLCELSEKWGVSRERVRQIEVRAVEKMREAMGVRVPVKALAA